MPFRLTRVVTGLIEENCYVLMAEGRDDCLVIDPGDEVLIPQPSFVCYEPLTIMAGATPVIIQTKAENAFRGFHRYSHGKATG